MQLNIYFKNVGQGDTLLLDWNPAFGAERDFGLIDCNLVDQDIQPVIRHIERENIRHFRFVLMSHPHWDHFSGFNQFLDYSEREKITIDRFFHTSSYDPNRMAATISGHTGKAKKEVIKEVITSGVQKKVYKDELQALYEKLDRMHVQKKTILERVSAISDDYQYGLGPDLVLKFLAPYNGDEIKQYLSKRWEWLYNNEMDEEVYRPLNINDPVANLLSSVIQIYSERCHWQVLLNADCEKSTLKRIVAEEMDRIRVNQVVAAQVPHHGSFYNHVEDFWSAVPNREKIPVFISNGPGNRLPDVPVVQYFALHYEAVHATNFGGGFRDYYKRPKGGGGKGKATRTALQLARPRLGRRLSSGPGLATNPVCCEKHIRITYGDDCDPKCEVINIP